MKILPLFWASPPASPSVCRRPSRGRGRESSSRIIKAHTRAEAAGAQNSFDGPFVCLVQELSHLLRAEQRQPHANSTRAADHQRQPPPSERPALIRNRRAPPVGRRVSRFSRPEPDAHARTHAQQVSPPRWLPGKRACPPSSSRKANRRASGGERRRRRSLARRAAQVVCAPSAH
jgi:hypothetical protein